VVCADGECLVLGIEVVTLRFSVGFAHSDGASGADTAGCDATRTVAEDVALRYISVWPVETEADETYSDNVEEADHDSEDARSDQEPPEGKTESLLASSFLVHVSEHVQSEDHHGAAQSHETMGRAQEWPVASEESAEERTLGYNEENADNSCNNVACGIEEEELVPISICS
jgi:hypothetical protein